TDELGQGAGSVDANGSYAGTAVDASGATRLVTDQDGNQWRYEVDGLGREHVRIDPLGARTTTSYNAKSQVSQVVDRLGRTIDYSYDAGDRQTGEVWKSSGGVTLNIVTYGYDSNDNRTSAWDGVGRVTYTYDGRDRVESYANVFGAVLTYTLDGNGNT